MSSQPSLSKSKNAAPQPVVSSRYLLRFSPPKIVLAFRPASLATLTNWTGRESASAIWSKAKTAAVRQRDRRKARRPEASLKAMRRPFLQHLGLPLLGRGFDLGGFRKSG